MSKKVSGIAFNAKTHTYTEFNSDQDETLLADLYKSIDCTMVETIQLTKNVSVWFDEEFTFKPTPCPATRLSEGSTILGNMVFLGATTPSGAMKSLDFEAFDKLRMGFEYGVLNK